MRASSWRSGAASRLDSKAFRPATSSWARSRRRSVAHPSHPHECRLGPAPPRPPEHLVVRPEGGMCDGGPARGTPPTVSRPWILGQNVSIGCPAYAPSSPPMGQPWGTCLPSGSWGHRPTEPRCLTTWPPAQRTSVPAVSARGGKATTLRLTSMHTTNCGAEVGSTSPTRVSALPGSAYATPVPVPASHAGHCHDGVLSLGLGAVDGGRRRRRAPRPRSP